MRRGRHRRMEAPQILGIADPARDLSGTRDLRPAGGRVETAATPTCDVEAAPIAPGG